MLTSLSKIRYLFSIHRSRIARIKATIEHRRTEVQAILVRLKRQKAWMLKNLSYAATSDLLGTMTVAEQRYALAIADRVFLVIKHLDIAIKAYEFSIEEYDWMLTPLAVNSKLAMELHSIYLKTGLEETENWLQRTENWMQQKIMNMESM